MPAAIEPPARPAFAPAAASAAPPEALDASIGDPSSWLLVHAGSRLLPVAGTEWLHDATARHWFLAHDGTIERTTSGLEPFLVSSKDPSGAERARRLRWVVGDARGLRYAYVEGERGPCADEDESLEPFLLERAEGEWRVLVLELRDPSAPLPLRPGDFDGGFVLVDSENSCGHGGLPFDYWLVTRQAPAPWPKPQHFTAPFFLGRRTFSTVAFWTFAVTEREEVVVFGHHHGRNAEGESEEFGDALELFRPGAETSEVVAIPEEVAEYSSPPLFRLTREAIALYSENSITEAVYEAGRWSSKERATTADEELFVRVDAELRAHPLVVEGAPFDLSELRRHGGLLWFSGVAGEREVTFVEGRARWKGGVAAVEE